MRPWRRELVRRIRQPVGTALPPVWVTLGVALVLAASVIALLEAKLRPVVAEIAAAQAQNTMTAVVEQAITEGLTAHPVGYGDLIDIQRDEGGTINALTADMSQMNLLRGELTGAILEALEGVEVSDIRVPLGSLFDLEPLWAKGPSLTARAMTVGAVRAEFDSQLVSAGVNQTLHRIWLEVEVPMTLLLPGGRVETALQTRLCVAETVIVGQVPDTFLQLGDSFLRSYKKDLYQ